MKKDYLSRFGLVLLIMLSTLLSVIYIKHLAERREPIVKLVPIVDPNYVQNPYEAQERLKAQGLYDGKIDGLWGDKTDRAYCDYCAKREFERE